GAERGWQAGSARWLAIELVSGTRKRRGFHVRDRRIRVRLEHDLLPTGGIREQCPQQLVVERVPGFVAAEFADQAVAEQIKIADRIQDLVLDELVLVAQAVLVEHAELIQHDRIVEVAAESQIVRAQRLQVPHEAEGARAAHFLQEGGGGEVHRRLLCTPFEDGVIELDLEVHLEAVERIELRPLVAVLHPHALLHTDEAFGRALLLDPGGLQKKYERSGAAIHDRDFHRAQLDDGVVDAQSREGGQQMLHRRHACVALAQSRAQGRLTDILRARPDVDNLGQICPPEYDSGVRLGRSKGHQHLLARVQTDAGGADRIFQRSLSNHELLRIVPVLARHPGGASNLPLEVGRLLVRLRVDLDSMGVHLCARRRVTVPHDKSRLQRCRSMRRALPRAGPFGPDSPGYQRGQTSAVYPLGARRPPSRPGAAGTPECPAGRPAPLPDAARHRPPADAAQSACPAQRSRWWTAAPGAPPASVARPETVLPAPHAHAHAHRGEAWLHAAVPRAGEPTLGGRDRSQPPSPSPGWRAPDR